MQPPRNNFLFLNEIEDNLNQCIENFSRQAITQFIWIKVKIVGSIDNSACSNATSLKPYVAAKNYCS